MEENEILSGEQEGEVVTPQGADDAAQGAEGEQSPDTAERDRQSREDNRRYQAARQAGDRAGYERAVREMNARIARSGFRDPDSGEDIRDIDGLESFSKGFRAQRIKARAEAEGRTVAEVTEEEDNRDFLSRMRQQEAEESRTRKAQEEKDRFVREDMAEFSERFPEEDISKLMENRSFVRFAGSRLGREKLADLYEDYQALKISAGAGESKSERATGSGGGKGGAVRLTAGQQRDLDEWNRSYPSMKMTAKEFLERG